MPTTPPSLHDESTRGLALAAILEVVRRRRMLVVLPVLFVLAAAISMAVFLPSLWTAKATLLVNRQEIPEALVRSTVNTDLEAQLLTLTYETLDAPRLTKIMEDNDLYPSLRRSKPPRRWSVCARTSRSRSRTTGTGGAPSRAPGCSPWATRPPTPRWPSG